MAAYLIEAGLLLIVAPWTSLWDHNILVAARPWLRALLEDPFMRGGVTGVGLVTAFAGVRDLSATLFARQASPAASGGDVPPPR